MAPPKETTFMREPPQGEDRWEAGTMMTVQQAIGAASFSVATLIYCMRIFARYRITHTPMRMDDYLTGAACVSCWAFFACTMGMVDYGGCAAHLWQVTQAQYENLLKWTIPVHIFYMLSTNLAKISLLFFYLQLSPDLKYGILIRTLVAAFVLYALVYALISIFACHPIYASWDLTAMQTAACVDKGKFFLAASIANVAMDLVILVLPLPIVLPLQIPWRQKVSLMLLFATGSFVIVVAIYNCVLTIKLFDSDDYTWHISYELSWMYAELAACIICASVSSIKPIFMHFLPQVLRSWFGYSSHHQSSGTGGGATPRGGGSRAAIKSKLNRGKQGGAIELESSDDSSESGRKTMGEDDEVKLWTRPDFRGEPGRIVQVSAGGHNRSGRPFPDRSRPDWDGGTVDGADSPVPSSSLMGINVVHTTEVTSYTISERSRSKQ
ncbi:hypothetical protein DL764_010899 [Monosporascus ibericus]|uniref:Rhodopsin domain-containing protein n=1 Tax=Monosporascus ibericus TaxID=155417 RepID=A0A4Q4SUB9_9PEZI|nr:hypothetical protein DL764_010899 [Monosporascus ibericus]